VRESRQQIGLLWNGAPRGSRAKTSVEEGS
jgi:hypothetical protein